MKRILTLIVLPLFLGLCGAVLRAIELAYSFDPVSGLRTTKLAATPALMVLCGVAVLAFLLISGRTRPNPNAPDAPRPVFRAVSVLAALILLALAAYQIKACVDEFVLTTLIQALLTVYCAVSLFAFGKTGLASRPSSGYAVLAVVPVFWACFTLILVYRKWIEDPILLDYVYLIFAFITLILFLFALTGYVYGKRSFFLAGVVGPLAIFFAIVELASQPIAALLPGTQAAHPFSLLEFGSLLAFLIFIPFALYEIFRNSNAICADSLRK